MTPKIKLTLKVQQSQLSTLDKVNKIDKIKLVPKLIDSKIDILDVKSDILDIKNDDVDVERFDTLPKCEQGDVEWLQQRYNFLTGSTVAKALGLMGQANKRNLMIEKVTMGEQGTFFGSQSTRWGNKYEPVANAIYSYRNGVKIKSFGMLTNPKYPILAISPDGILDDRMIEIKCPFSRVIIDGKIKKEYLHQMQMQMAVCEINQCDFLETSFSEYESSEKFWSDSLEIGHKGIIVELKNPSDNYKNVYIYSPIGLTNEELNQWEREMIKINLNADRYVDINYHYWKLDVYNCQLVKRDPQWILTYYPQLEQFWSDILKHRVIGVESVPDYDKYMASKNKGKDNFSKVGCLL